MIGKKGAVEIFLVILAVAVIGAMALILPNQENNLITGYAVAGITVASCNTTITNNSILTGPVNCVNPTTHGVIIGAKDITLDCQGNTLKGIGGSTGHGVYNNNFENVTVKNCVITQFNHGIFYTATKDGTIFNNTVYNNVGTFTDEDGIKLLNSNFTLVKENLVYINHYNGIELSYSHNNIVVLNEAFNHTGRTISSGIYLTNSNYNNVSENIAHGNKYAGITLDNADFNNITFNDAKNNSDHGISMWESNNNDLYLNNASNSSNYHGILMYSNSDFNTFDSNLIQFNNQYGINMSGCDNNTFTNNNISSNSDYGLYFSSSNNNTIYNNFISNSKNVNDDSSNYWNISKTAGTNIIGDPYLGGNYWSDYNGTDNDHDGLGDTERPWQGSTSITNGGDYLPLTYLITPEPNLTITKSDSPDPVYNGSQINYTIIIMNNGTGTANNVTLTEVYPLQTNYVNASPSPTSGNNVWFFSSLVNGSSIIINITVLVQSNITNNTNLFNYVNVTYLNSSNGTQVAITSENTTGLTPPPPPNLSVTKTDSQNIVLPGENFTYYITVTNNGLGTAQNITLTETYPIEFTFNSAVPSPNVSNNIWYINNLANGSSTTINISMQVKLNASAGTKTNSLTINYSDASNNTYSTNTSENTTVFVPIPNLIITKSDSPDPVYNGSQINYTITIMNNGTGTANNVTLTEVYPLQTNYVNASPSPTSGNNVWFFSSLINGSSMTINITVLVQSNITNGTNLFNYVNVTYLNFSNGIETAETSENTTGITPPPSPNLIMSKTDSADPVDQGNSFTYQITINNQGTGMAYNLTLVDTYPTGLNFVSSSPSPNATNNTWYLNNLVNGSSTTVNITMQVDINASDGSVTNSINVTYFDISNNPFSTTSSETTTLGITPTPTSTGGGSSGPTTIYECDDDLDNDNDGLIDYPFDPGCTSRYDNNESEATCRESWSCTSWGDCLNNQQTRICDDVAQCQKKLDSGTIKMIIPSPKPPEEKRCGREEPIPSPPPEPTIQIPAPLKKEFPLIPLIIILAIIAAIIISIGGTIKTLKFLSLKAGKNLNKLISESNNLIEQKNIPQLNVNYQKMTKLYKKLSLKEKEIYYKKIIEFNKKITNMPLNHV